MLASLVVDESGFQLPDESGGEVAAVDPCPEDFSFCSSVLADAVGVDAVDVN